jgi:hypothetical protein
MGLTEDANGAKIMTTACEICRKVGKAIARDVIADGLPREWTGLDPQDGDQLQSAGIMAGTPEWSEAEEAAREAYMLELRGSNLESLGIDPTLCPTPLPGWGH